MISSNQIGIPEEMFESLSNRVVFKFVWNKIIHNPKLIKWDYVRERDPANPRRWVIKGKRPVWDHLFSIQKTESFYGDGAVDFINTKSIEGFQYMDEGDAGYLMKDSDQDLMYSKSTNNLYLSKAYAEQKTDYSFSWKWINNGVFSTDTITLTEQQLADKLNMSVEKFRELINYWSYVTAPIPEGNYYRFGSSSLSIDNGQVLAGFYINNNPWDINGRFGDINFPLSGDATIWKRGMDFCVDWVLYNEHSPSTPPKWTSEGNFGEAARFRASKDDARAVSVNIKETDGEPGYDLSSNTFFYNPSRQAVLAFMPTLLPAAGKNQDWECCLDLKTGAIYRSRLLALKEAK